jgi:hypothetical protein
MARRWTRASGAAATPALAAGGIDAGLRQRLDDELRDLD